MHNDITSAAIVDGQTAEPDGRWQGVSGRRSFLKGLGLAGAAALPGFARRRVGDDAAPPAQG